jgi:hypothetical protein
MLCDKETSSLDTSANMGEVAEGLMTALNLQKPPVCDLSVQMVFNLKMTLYMVNKGTREK